jgi:hypothetical protein
LRARTKETNSSKLAILRVNGWGCGRRLLALGDLPKHPETQTEEQKITSKDESDHTWLLRDRPKSPDTTQYATQRRRRE